MLHIEQIFEELKEPKKIFITCHQKPDADAIGSTLGLYHYFKLKGHQPFVVVPNEMPGFLNWLPEVDQVMNFESEPKNCLKILKESDLIFCLDYNHLSRVKGLEKPLREAVQKKILIDHHLEPELDVFYAGTSDAQKSSTCEMVYDFIVKMGDQDIINNDIAVCLYTGTLTDTGSFRFSASRASTHRMVAFFKDIGLEHSIIHERIFDSWTENRMRFIGHALEKKMEILEDGKLGIIFFTDEELKSFNILTGDTEGLVNLPLSIESVKVSVLLTQKNGLIKLSFRSKGQIDVSSFSRKYFNGGGHLNAAGGSSIENMEATLNKIKTTIKEIL
ncbi:MAG TPA: DHH family phosphoesterase [Edaphocola sp.]|nr:DHH family phosphoesterase [Edaphocola sp.]